MREEKKDVLNVVLDTNILVSALIWTRGIRRKLFEKSIEGSFHVFTSTSLLRELAEILKREFNEPDEVINNQISFIISYTQRVEDFLIPSVIKNDPDDDIVIGCAIASNANFIVSGDKHLLDLKEYQGIKIVTAKEFLNFLENHLNG